jgi:putative flavoprotein involved in K+ transport
VANSWRSQRWPSLRLLTLNWLTRLPGYDYAGDDPDGYMPAAGVVSTLTRYARLAAAPVRTGATVHTVRTTPGGFEINDEMLYARAVVLATGACARPAIPAVSGAVPRPMRRSGNHFREPPCILVPTSAGITGHRCRSSRRYEFWDLV